MKIVFSPVAFQDLQRLYKFFKETNPPSITKAAERLKKGFGTLRQYPLAGYPLESLPPFRELLVPFGRGNFIIRYQLGEETVNVVHLWHSREERED